MPAAIQSGTHQIASGEQRTQHAGGAAAAPRLQRLEAERKELQTQLRTLAVLRLQRWYWALHWRTSILPRQLLSMRMLLCSCITIQRAWRTALAWRSASQCRAAWSLQLTQSDQALELLRAQDERAAVLSNAASKPTSPTGFIEGLDGTLEYLGVSSIPASASTASMRNESNPRTHESHRQTPTHQAEDVAQMPVQQFSPLNTKALSCAMAFWRGYRVRRALGSRVVQGKVQLRHDLYLLISDVEGRGKLSSNAHMPQRLAPWVDVLYSGLARLQNEVLSELHGLFRGDASLCSSQRCPLVWRGWSRDLLRLPQLVLDVPRLRNQSSPCSEPSLLASTAYQAITPPGSPRSLEEFLRTGPVQYEDWLQSSSSCADSGQQMLAPWGCTVVTPPTASQLDPMPLSGSQAGSTSPNSQDSEQSGPSHCSGAKLLPPQDWKKTKPRVRCWASPQCKRTRSDQQLGEAPACPVASSHQVVSESSPRWNRRKNASAHQSNGGNWAWPTPDAMLSSTDSSGAFTRVRPGNLGSEPESVGGRVEDPHVFLQ